MVHFLQNKNFSTSNFAGAVVVSLSLSLFVYKFLFWEFIFNQTYIIHGIIISSVRFGVFLFIIDLIPVTVLIRQKLFFFRKWEKQKLSKLIKR